MVLDHSKLESLIHIHVIQLYSEDICMSFGLDKCRTATVVRGKIRSMEGLSVSDNTITAFIIVRINMKNVASLIFTFQQPP